MSDISTDWVWSMPTVGIPWCTCGLDPLTGLPRHPVTRPQLTQAVVTALGSLPERVNRQELMRINLSFWKFPAMTPANAEALLRSVKAVTGEVPETFDTDTALAILKHFSNTWPGEPEVGK